MRTIQETLHVATDMSRQMADDLAAALNALNEEGAAEMMRRYPDGIDARGLLVMSEPFRDGDGKLVVSVRPSATFDALLAEARALATPSG